MILELLSPSFYSENWEKEWLIILPKVKQLVGTGARTSTLHASALTGETLETTVLSSQLVLQS